MNTPFEWAHLFTTEKFNERPSLNIPPAHLEWAPFLKGSAPALIQIITVIVISGDDLIIWDGLFQSYYHKTKE